MGREPRLLAHPLDIDRAFSNGPFLPPTFVFGMGNGSSASAKGERKNSRFDCRSVVEKHSFVIWSDGIVFVRVLGGPLPRQVTDIHRNPHYGEIKLPQSNYAEKMKFVRRNDAGRKGTLEGDSSEKQSP
ncbi:hypothetical protein AVEN_164298-1 [Araneus ventricosus]|uniref:Uncharacterized protein n=1 Tax=Araneus ventricosus TaxID=182803 RepID=A0A4Y2GZH5_ARAVE|nr:hypothetical protein AVEN_164298-1 [Araneus ventricosus]